MVERIRLIHPTDTYDVEPDPKYVAVIDAINEMRAVHESGGKLFVEFTTGDRKGSIAQFVPDYIDDEQWRRSYWYGRSENSMEDPRRLTLYASHDKSYGRNHFQREHGYYWKYNQNAFGTYRWTGRSNKPKADLTYDGGIVWLKGYDGPTVWQKFDAKAAKEKLLADHGQTDRYGSALSVGDRVIYCDLAYGSGASIEHGTIEAFTASVDSKRHTIYTTVKNVEKGHTMRTEKPEQLIMKVENAAW